MFFPTASYECLSLQVIQLQNNLRYIPRLSLTLKSPTAGAFCVPAPPQRVQLPQVRTAWCLDLLFDPNYESSALIPPPCCLGAAATYVPMSLHMPDHVKSTRAHQESLATIQAWWPATKRAPLVVTSPERAQLCTMSCKDLKREIFAAMNESFPNNNAFSTSNRIKTSASHPIKWVPGTRNFCCSTVLTASVLAAPPPSSLLSSYL